MKNGQSNINHRALSLQGCTHHKLCKQKKKSHRPQGVLQPHNFQCRCHVNRTNYVLLPISAPDHHSLVHGNCTYYAVLITHIFRVCTRAKLIASCSLYCNPNPIRRSPNHGGAQHPSTLVHNSPYLEYCQRGLRDASVSNLTNRPPPPGHQFVIIIKL